MNTTSSAPSPCFQSALSYDQVIAIYNQQLLLNPQARLYQYRGQAHLEQGNWPAAIADFQIAVRLYHHRGQAEVAAHLQSRIQMLQTTFGQRTPLQFRKSG